MIQDHIFLLTRIERLGITVTLKMTSAHGTWESAVAAFDWFDLTAHWEATTENWHWRWRESSIGTRHPTVMKRYRLRSARDREIEIHFERLPLHNPRGLGQLTQSELEELTVAVDQQWARGVGVGSTPLNPSLWVESSTV